MAHSYTGERSLRVSIDAEKRSLDREFINPYRNRVDRAGVRVSDRYVREGMITLTGLDEAGRARRSGD